MRVLALVIPVLAVLAASAAPAAAATEQDFLASLAGSWTGKGTMLPKIGSRQVNITCRLTNTAQRAALSMQGTCRGLLLVTRRISADLKLNGNSYRGTYVGPAGQPSALSGSRRGNTINLQVRWSRVTNGDRAATMTIERLGPDALRLSTIDKDPSSGRSIVTSRIDLTRQP